MRAQTTNNYRDWDAKTTPSSVYGKRISNLVMLGPFIEEITGRSQADLLLRSNKKIDGNKKIDAVDAAPANTTANTNTNAGSDNVTNSEGSIPEASDLPKTDLVPYLGPLQTCSKGEGWVP
eukprot:8024704-Pyramimonas_sp.AAC.1